MLDLSSYSEKLDDLVFDRLVFVFHSGCRLFPAFECVSLRLEGDEELERLGLITFEPLRRSSDDRILFYWREITTAGKVVIRTADPLRLVMVYLKHEMWSPLGSAIQQCSLAQLPALLTHEHVYVRSAAQYRLERLKSGPHT